MSFSHKKFFYSKKELSRILENSNLDIKSVNSNLQNQIENLNYNVKFYHDALYHQNLRIEQLVELYRNTTNLLFKNYLCENFGLSHSQLLQDLIAGYICGNETNYFVEIGAGDGIELSNSYFLEKEKNWMGLLVEPAVWARDKIASNRNSKIDFRCVWSTSGDTLSFVETTDPMFSTLDNFVKSDNLSKFRKIRSTYPVETISLNDLLLENAAPREIGALFLDTEGSEYEILRNFDFAKHSFNFIAVEHNFSTNKENIFKLLTNKGYVRILGNYSKWDDWYIHNTFNVEFGNVG